MNFEIMSEEAVKRLVDSDENPSLPNEVRRFYEKLKENIKITEDNNDGKKTFRFNIPKLLSTTLLSFKGRPTFNHHNKEHVEEVRNLCAHCLACLKKKRLLFLSWKDYYLEDFKLFQAAQRTRKKSPILEAFIAMLKAD